MRSPPLVLILLAHGNSTSIPWHEESPLISQKTYYNHQAVPTSAVILIPADQNEGDMPRVILAHFIWQAPAPRGRRSLVVGEGAVVQQC